MLLILLCRWKKVFLENEWVRQAFGITDLDTHSQHYK